MTSFTTAVPGPELARLATELDVDLLLAEAPDELLAEGTPDEQLTAVLAETPCDVALLVPRDESPDGPVFVPFGGVEHDWAAVEIGAWFARAAGSPLRLAGSAAVPEQGKRDASRLLSHGALAVQRVLGISAEPLLTPPGEDGILERAARRPARGRAVEELAPTGPRPDPGATREGGYPSGVAGSAGVFGPADWLHRPRSRASPGPSPRASSKRSQGCRSEPFYPVTRLTPQTRSSRPASRAPPGSNPPWPQPCWLARRCPSLRPVKPRGGHRAAGRGGARPVVSDSEGAVVVGEVHGSQPVPLALEVGHLSKRGVRKDEPPIQFIPPAGQRRGRRLHPPPRRRPTRPRPCR